MEWVRHALLGSQLLFAAAPSCSDRRDTKPATNEMGLGVRAIARLSQMCDISHTILLDEAVQRVAFSRAAYKNEASHHTTSTSSSMSDHQLVLMPGSEPFIRHRIRQLIERRDMKHEVVAKKYNNENSRRFPDRKNKRIGRTDITKLLSGTRKLTNYDCPILAEVLGVTIEELLGVSNLVMAPEIDPRNDLTQYEALFELLGRHLRDATELLSWAEFLPCSLETPDFMAAHHKGVFEALGPNRDIVAEFYDEIGRGQQDRLREAAHHRSWIFTHVIFESDLARIFSREDLHYVYCSRDQCLEAIDHLMALLTRVPSWNISFIVIPGQRPLQALGIQDCDSKVVVLDKHNRPTFSFWRNHTGVVRFTAAPVPALGDNLSTLRELQAMGTSDSTLGYLRDYRIQVAAWYA